MIKINELARELGIAPNIVLQVVKEFGDPETNTHSNSMDDATAEKIRTYVRVLRQPMTQLNQEDAPLGSQKNAVFREIEEKGLDPRHFRWTTRASDHVQSDEPRLVPVLLHFPTGFYFAFEDLYSEWSPGATTRIEVFPLPRDEKVSPFASKLRGALHSESGQSAVKAQRLGTRDFTQALAQMPMWLESLKRELEPDLWLSASSDGPLPSVATGTVLESPTGEWDPSLALASDLRNSIRAIESLKRHIDSVLSEAERIESELRQQLAFLGNRSPVNDTKRAHALTSDCEESGINAPRVQSKE